MSSEHSTGLKHSRDKCTIGKKIHKCSWHAHTDTHTHSHHTHHWLRGREKQKEADTFII